MKYLTFILSFGALLFILCCGKEGSASRIDLDDEKFTNFQITFNPVGGGDQIIFGYENIENVGVQQAAASGPLQVKTLYDARVVLFNRSVEPNKNLTESVIESGVDYQLYPIVQPDNIFQNIEYADMDDNGNPIGMNMSFETSERFVVGNLGFVLLRRGDKSARYIPGQELPVGIGGEVLVEANFEVVIRE